MPILQYYGNDILDIDVSTPNNYPRVMGVVLMMGKVKLIPPYVSNTLLPGNVSILKEFIIPEWIDGTVKIQNSALQPGSSTDISLEGSYIEGTVTFKNDIVSVQSNDISCTVKLIDLIYIENLFDDIEVIVPWVTDWDSPQPIPNPDPTNPNPIYPPNTQYESEKYGKCDIYGTVKLVSYEFEDPNLDISGSGLLTYELYKKDNALTGFVTLPKIEEVHDIDGTVSILKEDYEEELFDIAVRVPRYDVSVYIDTRIIVPKFRVQYSIPIDIQVVPWVCACFDVDIDVVNECIWEFDGNVSLPKIDIDDSIDSTVTLLPEAYEDINCTVKLNNLATYKQFDCSGFLIGRVIEEFDIDITTEPYEAPVYDFSEDIMDCVVHFGGKSIFDFDVSVKAEAIPLFDFKEDLIEGMVHLRDYKRIGIVVDPRWNYDAYVFKSSLLTLFDKYYDKTVLDIVYGGNPRSDWDIEHLGYVFHNKLTKVPIIFDPIHQDHTKRTIEHYIYHLSDTPIDVPIAKVFLFTDRPDYIASNPLSLITQFCKDNDIDFAIITSGGEFIDYHDNQAFSTTNNPLRTEPHSVLGPLSVMPMDTFNRVAEPSDPKHPYYHPTKIIY